MTSIRTHLTCLGAAGLLAAASTGAHAVTLVFDPGTAFQTDALSGFTTNGNDMATSSGIAVTALFSAGGSETQNWGSTGSNSGGVTGTGWSLSQSGNTFGGLWTLDAGSASLTGIVISGSPGDTVFDLCWTAAGDSCLSNSSGATGTAGSANGWTFEVTSGTEDLTATYSNIVNLTGQAAVGDLWETLSLDFDADFTNQRLQFIADTDQAASAGDITPVPEPGTLALLSLGLLALRRRLG